MVVEILDLICPFGLLIGKYLLHDSLGYVFVDVMVLLLLFVMMILRKLLVYGITKLLDKEGNI